MANYSTLRQHYNVKCKPIFPLLLNHLLTSTGSTKVIKKTNKTKTMKQYTLEAL